MSGIEVIGLILGGLPLIISAAENYKRGFEPLSRWRRFRFVFQDFINEVDFQRQMFQLVMVKLLIQVQLEPGEKQLLLTTSDYAGWRQENVIEALKSRLGDSYDAFMAKIKAVNEDMIGLQEMMSLKDGSVDWANPGEKQWKYQAKRIQLSFSGNGERTIQSLGRKIQDLKGFLELLDSTNETLDGMKTVPKDTTWGKFFDSIRRHALGLHSAIKNSWKCDCEGSHLAGLHLQKRQPTDQALRFTLNFPLPQQDLALPNLQRKVVIHVKESKGDPSLMRPQPVPVQESYIKQLRTNFETKSLSDISINTLPIRSSLQSSNSSTSSNFSFTSIFTKSESNMVTSSSVSIPNGNEVLVENEPRKWGAMRKSKAKKSLRFQSDLPADSGKADDTTLRPISAEERKSPAKGLSSNEENPGIDIKVDDLCTVLQTTCITTDYLGYLLDDGHRKHELWWTKQSNPASQNSREISLEQLLAKNAHLRLSRQKRYRIASIVASSLLQLQATPWLTENLEKKQILFQCQGSEVLVEELHISYNFGTTKEVAQSPQPPKVTEARRMHPRKTLSSLAVLLLELCFGEAIENQTELRKAHLSTDGKALEGTDYLTARDWLDSVAEEEPKMTPIINCCLYCLFEGKPNWADPTFIQAVYISVVQPLEMLVVPS